MRVLSVSTDAVTATPNATMTTMAAPSRGSAELSVWSVRMEAGSAGPMHRVDREQVWVLTGGSVEITTEGKKERVSEGQVVILSPGLTRQVCAPHEPADALVSMRADGAVSVDGPTGVEHRPLPWAE